MKKILTFLLFIIFAFCCCSCTREDRFDYSELSIRLEKQNDAFAFNDENIFYSQQVYYTYYSFDGEDDVLLTAKEDTDGSLIRITLSVWGSASEKTVSAYLDFCSALKTVFIPEERFEEVFEPKELLVSCNIFSDIVESSQTTNYTAQFFSSELGAVYVLSFV